MNDDLKARGWTVLPGVVSPVMLAWMRGDMDVALKFCRDWQVCNDVGGGTEGTVHHLAAFPVLGSFLAFLDINPAANVIADFFGGPYILNSFGGNFNLPGRPHYANKVHRDQRSWSHDRLMLNTLVTLDDTTQENGATWLLSGSHNEPGKPSDELFNNQAVQVCAPAGSIILWDSRVWHRAGDNRADKPRRIVTPIFTRPWMKQGFDYPRALGYDVTWQPALHQVLGYNSRVPATFDEWYQPPDKRMYLGSQG